MGVLIPVGFMQVTVIMRGPSATKNSTWSLGFDPTTLGGVPAMLGTINSTIQITGNPCDEASMVVGWQYLGLDATYMDDTGPLLFSVRNTVTGTKSGAPLPVNCAFLISKGTARGGRAGRGRIFFPPALIGESGIDGNGIIDSGALPIIQAYWTDWLDDLEAGGAPPYLFHDSVGAPDVITAMTLQAQLATQRRRMR